jgi:hypothetical protein
MIRHIVDGDQFLLLTGNNAGDVFLEFIVVFRRDKILPAFDREHDVDVNLRVSVGHAPKMPLLTELENLFLFGFYKDVAPLALGRKISASHEKRSEGAAERNQTIAAGDLASSGMSCSAIHLD